ncbi:MAG: TIR domain-containing protein [Verrucomicrobiota bacterium]
MYDVALSFAGEDRDYVEEVAGCLKHAGIKVFYDDYERAGLWGKNLYTHLSKIYKDDSRYVVIFISKYYANKVWTNHERESAQAKAFTEKAEYILPARLDDTEIPGILPTTGYIDLRTLNPAEFSALIVKKLMDGDNLEKELAEFSHICKRIYQEAHRGAILWRKDVTAIFDNRLAKSDDAYLLAVRADLAHLPHLAQSGSGSHPIVAFYQTNEPDAAFKIHDLMWDRFLERIGETSTNLQYVGFQKKIADQVTGTARYKPFKGDIHIRSLQAEKVGADQPAVAPESKVE